MAHKLLVVSVARSWSAARNETWCERSPRSAAVTAYCMGTVLHSRPSASFPRAAVTSFNRGDRPTPIQPVRHPGARYALDRLENEMIAAPGSRLPIDGRGPAYP